jgi:TetR/AcrR family transcriptional repressor of nem operon
MDMREQILTIAQHLVQQRGFNGFSYADIAEEVGIRKPSLHHHFPSKVKLGIALIENYTSQLETELGRISVLPITADAKLASYIALYRTSLDADYICLGGMLASDVLTLDDSMLPGLKRFFAMSIEWLSKILSEGESMQHIKLKGPVTDHAHMLLSTLQGALMIARASGDVAAFDRTTALILASLRRKG